MSLLSSSDDSKLVSASMSSEGDNRHEKDEYKNIQRSWKLNEVKQGEKHDGVGVANANQLEHERSSGIAGDIDIKTHHRNDDDSSSHTLYGKDHQHHHETLWDGFLTFLSDALSRGQFEHDEDEAQALEELHKAYEHLEEEEKMMYLSKHHSHLKHINHNQGANGRRNSIEDDFYYPGMVRFHKEKINYGDEDDDTDDDDEEEEEEEDDDDDVNGSKNASPTEISSTLSRQDVALSNESVSSVVMEDHIHEEYNRSVINKQNSNSSINSIGNKSNGKSKRSSKSSNPIHSTTTSSKARTVRFKSDVDVMTLPKGESKEANNARKGTWVAAPNMDVLWDGEEKRFWDKQLTPDELKQIIKERRNKQLQKFMGIVSEYFDNHVIQPGTSALHNIKSSVQTQSELARNREYEHLKQKFSHYESAFKEKMAELIEYQKNSILQAGNQLLHPSASTSSSSIPTATSLSSNQDSSSTKRLSLTKLNENERKQNLIEKLQDEDDIIHKRSSMESSAKGSHIGHRHHSHHSHQHHLHSPKRETAFDAAVHQDRILENRATHSALFAGQFQELYVAIYFALPLIILFMIHFGQWLVAEFMFSPHKIDWHSRIVVHIPQKTVDWIWPSLVHDGRLTLRGIVISVFIAIEISSIIFTLYLVRQSQLVSTVADKVAKSIASKASEKTTPKVRSWRKGSARSQRRASSNGSIGSAHLENTSRRSSTSSSIHSVQNEAPTSSSAAALNDNSISGVHDVILLD